MTAGYRWSSETKQRRRQHQGDPEIPSATNEM